MMRVLFLCALTSFFMINVSSGLWAQDCSCIDCPVSISNLQTHSSSIDVQVAGPNDLGQCGLNEVCFTIVHSWVGDLSVSLISPAGKKYLIMADAENNPPNGCGNSSDNIDICIRVGTDNPITNNTEYNCNGTGFFCLEGGGFTVPCGGVTDPFDGAVQAPNCNLSDFNVPGDPANGQWTLIVNDICDLNIGQLTDWSLSFDCGTSSCQGCEAEGGELLDSDINACVGDPILDMNVQAVFSGAAPDPLLFDYAYIIQHNGLIHEVTQDVDLLAYTAGNYSVCGISFPLGELANLTALVGSPFVDLAVNFPYCYDLSDDCIAVSISDPEPSFTEEVFVCSGDCYTALDGLDYCTEGSYLIEYNSAGLCTSQMTLIINEVDHPVTQMSITVCAGEEFTFGQAGQFGPGVHSVLLTDMIGCDSIVELTIEELTVHAEISSSGTDLNCSISNLILDGSNSDYDVLEWFDDQWVSYGQTDGLLVSSEGVYHLVASKESDNGTCLDTSSITITYSGVLPDAPVFSSYPVVICDQGTGIICVEEDPLSSTLNWNIPTGVSIVGNLGGGCYELEWSQGASGSICVFGSNDCGNGPQTCVDITVEEDITLLDIVEDCDLFSETYSLSIDLAGTGITLVSSNISAYSFDGTNFQASGIPGDLTYELVFGTANCSELSLSNSVNCVCENQSPVLEKEDGLLCLSTDLIFEDLGPSNSSDMATVYVLHQIENDPLNSSIEISDQAVFSFDSSIMSYGSTLYVTAYRGIPNSPFESPFIDFNGPCLELSNTLSFEFAEESTATINLPDICEDDLVIMEGVFDGQGPFVVEINQLEYEFSANGSIILFQHPLHDYTFNGYTDGNGCYYTVEQPLDLDIYTPENVELSLDTITLCNSTWGGNATEVDLNSLLIDLYPGSWEDNAQTGALTGTIFNADGLSEGYYGLVFTTSTVSPCPVSEADLIIKVEACECPELNNNELTVCNVDGFIDLETYIPQGLEGGYWSLEFISGNSVQLPIIDQDQLLFGGQEIEGSFLLQYDFSFINIDGCSMVDSLVVHIESVQRVELIYPEQSICISELPVDLDDLAGADGHGEWVWAGGQEAFIEDNILISSSSGVLDLIYVGPDGLVCSSDTAEFTLELIDAPDGLMTADRFVNIHCYETEIQIGSASLCSNPDYQFIWHALSPGVDLDNPYSCTPTVTGSGVFELVIYDESTHCETLDTVTVEIMDDGPSFDIEVEGLSCHDEADGVISVEDLNVVNMPYTLFLNDEPINNFSELVGLSAGSYEFVVEDAMGCLVKEQVVLNNPMPLELYLDPVETYVQIGEEVELNAFSNLSDVTYNWYTENGNYLNHGNQLVLNIYFNQEVRVEVVSESGCIRSLPIIFEAVDKYKVFVPNAFSPDGDGINDAVTIMSGAEIELVKSFRVFSRWGELMFENFNFVPNDFSNGWDGTIANKPANVGEYVWYAKIEMSNGEERTYKGDFALLRN